MIISYFTLFPIDKTHAEAVVIGITFPVRDKVIELDVVAILTNVSNDFITVIIVS